MDFKWTQEQIMGFNQFTSEVESISEKFDQMIRKGVVDGDGELLADGDFENTYLDIFAEAVDGASPENYHRVRGITQKRDVVRADYYSYLNYKLSLQPELITLAEEL